MKSIKLYYIGQQINYNGLSHIIKSIDHTWERLELFNTYTGSSYLVSVSQIN